MLISVSHKSVPLNFLRTPHRARRAKSQSGTHADCHTRCRMKAGLGAGALSYHRTTLSSKNVYLLAYCKKCTSKLSDESLPLPLCVRKISHALHFRGPAVDDFGETPLVSKCPVCKRPMRPRYSGDTPHLHLSCRLRSRLEEGHRPSSASGPDILVSHKRRNHGPRAHRKAVTWWSEVRGPRATPPVPV